MSDNISGYTRITTSTLINEGSTLLYGVSVQSVVSGIAALDFDGTVVIYEGQDATTGRVLMTLEVEPDGSLYNSFDNPVRLERGLYVSLGTHVTDVTLFWVPGGVR